MNLTWHRINCKQQAIPWLISVDVRKAEGLFAESRSKCETRLYVRSAMFSFASNKPAQMVLRKLVAGGIVILLLQNRSLSSWQPTSWFVRHVK